MRIVFILLFDIFACLLAFLFSYISGVPFGTTLAAVAIGGLAVLFADRWSR